MKSNKKKEKPRGNPRIVEAGIATRFKPGVCPNPGGRPRRTPYADAHRCVAGLSVAELQNSPGDSVAIAVAKAVAREAMKGKIPAAVEAANRTEGRPRETEDEREHGPVTIRVVQEPLPRRENKPPRETGDAVAETMLPYSPKGED